MLNSLIIPDHNSSLRVDKNMAYNISDFKRYDKMDQIVIKNLIIYMSLTFQKNLFNLVEIDPKDFIETMKLNRSSLIQEHKNPLFYKINSKSKEELKALELKHGRLSKYRIWDSVLENALFILQYENIISSYAQNTNTVERVSITSFSYIKSLHVTYKKTGKTKKIVYEYEPSDEFELSLKKFFFNITVENFVKLRSSNLEDCYLNLINRIQSENYKNNNRITFALQNFAELLNVKHDTIHQEKGFSNIKKNCARKFNTKFIPIVQKEIPNISLKWIKGPNSKFTNLADISWLKLNPKLLKDHNNKIYDDLFFTEFFKDLSVYYENNHQRFESDLDLKFNGFIDWMMSYEDIEIKQSKYVSVFANIKGKIDNLEQKARDYIINLADLQELKLNDKDFLKCNNGTFSLTMNNKVYKYGNLKDVFNEINTNISFFKNRNP